MLGIWTQILIFVEQVFFLCTELSSLPLHQILWLLYLWPQWLLLECYPRAPGIAEVICRSLCASLMPSSVNNDNCNQAFIYVEGAFLFNLIFKYVSHIYHLYRISTILHLILKVFTLFTTSLASPWRLSLSLSSIARTTCCLCHSGWGVVTAPHHPYIHLTSPLHEVTKSPVASVGVPPISFWDPTTRESSWAK